MSSSSMKSDGGMKSLFVYAYRNGSMKSLIVYEAVRVTKSVTSMKSDESLRNLLIMKSDDGGLSWETHRPYLDKRQVKKHVICKGNAKVFKERISGRR